MEDFRHISKFAVPNRPYKRKSKGKVERRNRGRVNQKVRIGPKTVKLSSSRADRINAMIVKRKLQRQKLLAEKRRRFSTTHDKAGVPLIVGIIPLTPFADCSEVQRALVEGKDICKAKSGLPVMVQHKVPGAKKRPLNFTFWSAPRSRDAILDIAKVADTLIFVIRPDRETRQIKLDLDLGLDEFGGQVVVNIKAQGVPNVMCVVQGTKHIGKNENAFKKLACRFMELNFPNNSKVLPLSSADDPAHTQDVAQIYRYLSEHKLHSSVSKQRPYLLANRTEFALNEDSSDYGCLAVEGYLRGSMNLDPNRLVHITGLGEYRVLRVEGFKATEGERAGGGDVEMADVQNVKSDGSFLLGTPNPELQDTLDALTPLDTLATAHDQSMITEQEIQDSQAETKENKDGSKSTIEHWYDILGLERDPDLPFTLPHPNQSTTSSVMTGDWTKGIDPEAEVKLEQREEYEFPDEVDTPEHTPAKEYFRQYRGLKSFVKSDWDKNESLPLPYSRVFHLNNFEVAAKRIMNEPPAPSSIPPGQKVRVFLSNVPSKVIPLFLDHPEQRPLILSSLLLHENKVSVCHFLLRKDVEMKTPIKTGDPFVFHVGFRRFKTRPVFNDTSRFDKHLVQKFMFDKEFTTATCYAKITVTPSPCLVFNPENPDNIPPFELEKQDEKTEGETSELTMTKRVNPNLVACGKLSSVDANRLLIKRIILTGYPMRVHKRKAVVRYMFWNPPDIRWFMPCELTTKYGLHGKIEESLGTKGYMKCFFSDHIKQNDTVCLKLYKRQFPWPDPGIFHDMPVDQLQS